MPHEIRTGRVAEINFLYRDQLSRARANQALAAQAYAHADWLRRNKPASYSGLICARMRHAADHARAARHFLGLSE